MMAKTMNIETRNTSEKILFNIKTLRKEFISLFNVNNIDDGTKEDIVNNVMQQFNDELGKGNTPIDEKTAILTN
ncbi:MAG: hypothetical protein DSY77_08860, partial [Bacteroidetes bacterium]